jgi:hypothetical protein
MLQQWHRPLQVVLEGRSEYGRLLMRVGVGRSVGLDLQDCDRREVPSFRMLRIPTFRQKLRENAFLYLLE